MKTKTVYRAFIEFGGQPILQGLFGDCQKPDGKEFFADLNEAKSALRNKINERIKFYQDKLTLLK